MKTHKRPELSVAEQTLLAGVKVCLIEKAEQGRFDALLEAEHYLHSAKLVGEQLRYVAEYEGRVTISLAVHWLQHCKNKRQATLRGFYDFMAARNAKKAFSLVTVCKSSWLPPREISAMGGDSPAESKY